LDPGFAEHSDHVLQDFLGQIPAQFDVHAAAGHIGGDGDAAKRPGPGDDL